MMDLYRVNFRLRSAVASAFQADTIFGHLCWALRYLEGEEALLDFLKKYDGSSEPPLLISEGFPGDLLPRPLIVPGGSKCGTKLEQMAAYEKKKTIKKIQWLSLDEFNQAINGNIPVPEKDARNSHKHVTLKNQISRLTGTTGEGGQLFEFEEEFWRYREGEEIRSIPVSIYLKVAEGFEKQVRNLFEFVAEQGYGKRKSVGYGAIESMTFEPFDGFAAPPNPNGFVSLSGFVPAASNPVNGFWKTLVKYGKLGEEFASGENPFKKPLIMLTAGSVFFDDSPREWYGRLVPKVANMKKPDIVQYAFAFPVPMIIPS